MFLVAAFSYNDSNGMSAFNPVAATKHKGRKSCLFSKVVKFDHFKIWVMDYFPYSEKFNCISIS